MKPNLKFSNEHDDIEENFDKFWRDTICAGLFLVLFSLATWVVFEVLILN